MVEIIFFFLFVIGCVIVGVAANRFNTKLFQRPKTTYKTAVIPSIAILVGLIAGSIFVPSALVPKSTYMVLVIALAVVFVLGPIEVLAIRRFGEKWLSFYILDNQVFPYVSLGLASALFFK